MSTAQNTFVSLWSITGMAPVMDGVNVYSSLSRGGRFAIGDLPG